MAPPRYTDLETLHTHVWDDIEAAAEDSGHPYRQITFGTVHENAPDLRTVILRTADADERVLQFHSDRRSRKVTALRDNDRIAWHAWDPDALEQIRLYGRATVHLDDDVAMALWESQSPSSLTVFTRPSAPGTPLSTPDDGLREAVKEEPITEDDVAPGRQHFAAIRTVIDRLEWLHLHPDGHYRAQFEYPDGEEGEDGYEATWLVP